MALASKGVGPVDKSDGANASIVLAMELPIDPQSSVAYTSQKTTYPEGVILSMTWSVDFDLRLRNLSYNVNPFEVIEVTFGTGTGVGQ